MKKLYETLGIPPFKTYEELLSSSWLAVRVATLTVAIMAFQSKKVIEAFSLYEGAVVWIHSILWTGVTAFAVLHFTIKLSKVNPQKKTMRKQLGWLIIVFSFIELLLGVGYHVIWFNQQAGVDTFTIPPMTPAFAFTIFLDALLPATLYFYGHTIQMKTQTEYDMLNPPKEEAPVIGEEKKIDPLTEGDELTVEVPGFGTRQLIVKQLKKSGEISTEIVDEELDSPLPV